MSGPRHAGRRVTLVVAVGGDVLGALPSFDVDTPWWQDVEPIVARHGDLAVLRLLVADAGDALLGGAVTYLAEPRAPTWAPPARLRPWHATMDDDPLRMPWARPGGPARDLDWAASVVGRLGDPTQHRTWNLSAIWSLPVSEGRAWLKCVPPFMAHEAGVLALLAGRPVPTVLAADGHRLLLEQLPGVDGYDAPLDQRRALVDELVALQSWSATGLEAFLAAGVPDRRLPGLLEAARAVVARRAPDDEPLGRLLGDAARRIDAIDACGLPDVLVHGDAHGGNARVGEGTGRGLWYDWGDTKIGHPLLDLAVLDRPGAPHAAALESHWLGAWSAAVPGSDPTRAWRLLRPFAALAAAVVYQAFLDQIERSERVFHEGDVLPWLARAAALAEGAAP